MPPIKGLEPSRRLTTAACALTLSLAIGACTPAGRDAEPLARVQSAFGAVTAPIAVAKAHGLVSQER
jgi:hypothetical protein